MSKKGFSLVAVLVSAVLVTLFFLFFFQHSSIISRSQAHVEIRADILDLRNYIVSNLSCPATCTPATYPGNFLSISLLNQAPPPYLIQDATAGTYTAFGQYLLRASCVSCTTEPGCSNSKRLLIEFMRGTNAATPLGDPLTKKTYSWADLFDGIPVSCPPLS